MHCCCCCRRIVKELCFTFAHGDTFSNATFLKRKMCQTRPLFVYFHPFLSSMTNIIQKLTIMEKRRWCAWDANLGPHDGWRRPVYWARFGGHISFVHNLDWFFHSDFPFLCFGFELWVAAYADHSTIQLTHCYLFTSVSIVWFEPKNLKIKKPLG